MVTDTRVAQARAQQELLLRRLLVPPAINRPAVQPISSSRNPLLAGSSVASRPRQSLNWDLDPWEAQLLMQQLRAGPTPPPRPPQSWHQRQQQQRNPTPSLLQTMSLQNQLTGQNQFLASVTTADRLAAASAAYLQPMGRSLSVGTAPSGHSTSHIPTKAVAGLLGAPQNTTTTTSTTKKSFIGVAGRAPFPVYKDEDKGRLTPYQCLARQHLEYFEAGPSQVGEGAQGRNKPIVLGQVGIRCCHCAGLPRKDKPPAAAFYPSRLSGIYQSAQNIINSHLVKDCGKVPAEVRERLLSMANRKSPPGTGKTYWSDEAVQVGIFEDEHGLRFLPSEEVETALVSSATKASLGRNH